MADLTANNTDIEYDGLSYDFVVTMDSSTAQTVYIGHPLILDRSVDSENLRVWNSGDTFDDDNDHFVGVAAEAATITLGSTESTNTLNAWTGTIGIPNDDNWTTADVGTSVYMPDSGTFALEKTGDDLHIGEVYNISVDDATAYIALRAPADLFLPKNEKTTPVGGMKKHNILGDYHSIDAAAGDLVSATAAGVLGVTTPTADSAATPNTPLKGDGTGSININNLTTAGTVTTKNILTLERDGDAAGEVMIVSYRDSPNTHARFLGRAAFGSESSPAALEIDAPINQLGGVGHDGSGWGLETGIVQIVAREPFTPSAQGTRVDIYTTPIGSTTRRKTFYIGDGGVLGSPPNGDEGYGVLSTENGLYTNGVVKIGGTTLNESQLKYLLNLVPQAPNPVTDLLDEAVGYCLNDPSHTFTAGEGETQTIVTDLADLVTIFSSAVNDEQILIRTSGTLDLGGGNLELTGDNFRIDARGFNVTITNGVVRFDGATNAAIAGIKMINAGGSNRDNLTIRNSSTAIFVLDCEMTQSTDGALDIIWGAGVDVYVTVKGCLIKEQQKAVLIDSGSSDPSLEGDDYYVTFVNNHFDWVKNRSPFCRNQGSAGKIDFVNNVHTNSGEYDGTGEALTVRDTALVYAQNNAARPFNIGVTTWDGGTTTGTITQHYRLGSGSAGSLTNAGTNYYESNNNGDTPTAVDGGSTVTAPTYTNGGRAWVQSMDNTLMDTIINEAGPYKWL